MDRTIRKCQGAWPLPAHSSAKRLISMSGSTGTDHCSAQCLELLTGYQLGLAYKPIILAHPSTVYELQPAEILDSYGTGTMSRIDGITSSVSTPSSRNALANSGYVSAGSPRSSTTSMNSRPLSTGCA